MPSALYVTLGILMNLAFVLEKRQSFQEDGEALEKKKTSMRKIIYMYEEEGDASSDKMEPSGRGKRRQEWAVSRGAKLFSQRISCGS